MMPAAQKINDRIISSKKQTGQITIPSAEKPITALNPDELRLSFSAFADIHIDAFLYNRVYLDHLLLDIANAETHQDALVVAGDVTDNSFDDEWKIFYGLLGKYNPADNYLVATGNHDIRIRSYKKVLKKFTTYYNKFTGNNINSLHYSMNINGYTFAVVGSDARSFEKQVLSGTQLNWLDLTVAEATKDGKPVFVIIHQPFRNTHGLPLLWYNGKWDSGYIGDQSEDVFEILNKYENVIMISGHMHSGFGQYTYEKVGNIYSVNLPSTGLHNKHCDYGDGDFSLGYTAEVYDHEVLFRARDFGRGVYVPEHDIKIPIK